MATSRRREQILEILLAAERVGAPPPSYQELADEFELAKGSIQTYLSRMAADDLVELPGGPGGQLEVTPKGRAIMFNKA